MYRVFQQLAWLIKLVYPRPNSTDILKIYLICSCYLVDLVGMCIARKGLDMDGL